MSFDPSRLDARFERLRQRLDRKWKGDPTVLASFRADYESLLVELGQGDTRVSHALIKLGEIYDEHLPPDSSGVVDSKWTHVGDRGSGAFYIRGGSTTRVPGVVAGAAEPHATPQHNGYGDLAKRTLWLAYTSGARQRS